VLWIRTTELRIRILPLSSVQWLTRCNKKSFFPKFFCLLLYEGAFTSVFINKMSKKSHKNSRNQGFLHFLLVYGRIRIRTQILTDPGGPKHTIRIHNKGKKYYNFFQFAQIFSVPVQK
jgi:hypothetical protein